MPQSKRRPNDIQRDVMINYLKQKLQNDLIKLEEYLKRIGEIFRYDKSNKKKYIKLPDEETKQVQPKVSIFKISNQSFHFIKNYMKTNRDELALWVKFFRSNSCLCYYQPNQAYDSNHFSVLTKWESQNGTC